MDLAVPYMFDPLGQLAAQEFVALVIDDEKPDMLISRAPFSDIFARLLLRPLDMPAEPR